MKKVISVICLLMALFTMASIVTSASSAYQTYTYSIEGEPLYSPDAYTAKSIIDSTYMGLETPLSTRVNDLEVDSDYNVYLADSGNNRIVVLDRYFKFKFEISSFINGEGIPDNLKGPQGVFVTDTTIWVCDTEAYRIVAFDREGNFIKILEAPESNLLDSGTIYMPIAMAVDQYNRLYVVSGSNYQGIMVLDDDGNFQSFIGAQATSLSVWQIIWRRFQTKEQRAASTTNVSTAYNNIAITPDTGLLYVTTSSIEEEDVASAIVAGNTDGTYLPVKLLNSKGSEIMRRNGFWPPAGEIQYSTISSDEVYGPSTIIDVAVGPENTWSIIDEKRSKIFTYDYDGNLLFAFGDTTMMMGSITAIKAITYQGDKMLAFDGDSSNIVVYERTPYGDMLLEAIAAQNSLDYEYAIVCWKEVLQHNSNFDAAYVGIGQAYFRSGEYETALEYYEKAYDTENWSDAYKEARKEWMSKGLIPVLFGVLILLIVIGKLLGKVGQINQRVAVSGKKPTYWQELAYGFHLIMHPFDGYWDLKHEKRGSVRAALTILAITILTFFYQDMAEGYVMDPEKDYMAIWVDLLAVGLPLGLYVLSNWCLTTLFDGEGRLKDVFIAACYSLFPIPLILIPTTILSNYVTESEKGIITFLIVISYIWMGLLLFFGTAVTHDYTSGKNVVTTLGTILGMIFIMFITILFVTLLAKLSSLIINIVEEIQYR